MAINFLNRQMPSFFHGLGQRQTFRNFSNPYRPAVAGDPLAESQNFSDQLRLNMALSDKPEERINLAKTGNYFIPGNDPLVNMANIERKSRLDMALAGNPMGRIDLAKSGAPITTPSYNPFGLK